eukprot:5292991-Pyramimonas_sp.AAC.1
MAGISAAGNAYRRWCALIVPPPVTAPRVTIRGRVTILIRAAARDACGGLGTDAVESTIQTLSSHLVYSLSPSVIGARY